MCLVELRSEAVSLLCVYEVMGRFFSYNQKAHPFPRQALLSSLVKH